MKKFFLRLWFLNFQIQISANFTALNINSSYLFTSNSEDKYSQNLISTPITLKLFGINSAIVQPYAIDRAL